MNDKLLKGLIGLTTIYFLASIFLVWLDHWGYTYYLYDNSAYNEVDYFKAITYISFYSLSVIGLLGLFISFLQKTNFSIQILFSLITVASLSFNNIYYSEYLEYSIKKDLMEDMIMSESTLDTMNKLQLKQLIKDTEVRLEILNK